MLDDLAAMCIWSVHSFSQAMVSSYRQPNNAFEWEDSGEELRAREMIMLKQQTKERDGFCRRVDIYDGQILTVDGKDLGQSAQAINLVRTSHTCANFIPAGKACYELGNYLGGGVAGVVYEGHRLLPSEDYPVRQGIAAVEDVPPVRVVVSRPEVASPFMCGDPSQVDMAVSKSNLSRWTAATDSSVSALESAPTKELKSPSLDRTAMDVAIETTMTDSKNGVFVDRLDAPSRSKHAAMAAASASQWFMEETVAIKILNPVAFRILSPDATQTAVVVREGEPMPRDVEKGKAPMQDKHVWWLVNPNSRNLQTLMRYNLKRQDGTLKKARDVDRGTPDRGLRLSLVAAYMDSTGELRELPLTRCIEIWGHVPFDATETEFDDMIESIERVNAGFDPSPTPSRVPTGESAASIQSIGTDLTDGIRLIPSKT
jgi:hypothetical protein